jgi:hypothetical protein
MRIKPLLEAYVTSELELVKKLEHPIYSFPLKPNEKKELIDNAKPDYPFRIIADSIKKKLYIFNYDILHHQADKALNINKYFALMNNYKFENDPVVYGYVKIIKGDFYSDQTAFPKKGYDFVWKYIKKR